MARPPRVHAPGEVFLVTTATWRRCRILDRPPIAAAVVETLFECRDEDSFDLHAWVLMPDHLHLVVQPNELQLVDLMRRFKSLAWRRCRETAGLIERLWQSGFHDRGVTSEHGLRLAIDYIHANPVRGGLVEHAEDWP
jgi:REP element-mobilizing transposase RayT